MTEVFRAAAIAITPPTYRASGGVAAGTSLMLSVAARVETHMLIMSDRDEIVRDRGLVKYYVRSVNPLFRFRRVLPRGLVTLMWRANFDQWLDEIRPDIVHLHNPHPPGALAAAARACRKRRIPYVITTHGFVEFDDVASGYGAKTWLTPIVNWLFRRPVASVARRAERVLILSPEEMPVLARMGVDPNRLEVVSNGVDSFFVDPLSERDRLRLVERFHLPPDKPLLFFVGNHTHNKGIDVLLDALREMKQPAVAIIAGAKRSEEDHRAMLERAGYDSSSCPAIFTDFISRDELKALYQSVDIFVFPSRADTLPLVVIEAMVSRLPVVSTRVGGIPFQVTDKTGILVEPGDSSQLARAIDTLSSDEQLRREMGEAGHERALAMFNWERSAERTLEIYRQVLCDEACAKTATQPIHD